MATRDHCFYCFEALFEGLDAEWGRESDADRAKAGTSSWRPKGPPMTLAQVEKSRLEYEAARRKSAGVAESLAKTVAVDAEEVVDDADKMTDEDVAATSADPNKKASPALRRLLSPGSGPSASSSSSSSSLASASSTSLQSQPSGVSTPATSISSASPSSTSLAPSKKKLTESPLFVTWNTVLSPPAAAGNNDDVNDDDDYDEDDEDHDLRGCIGTFDAQELSVGLRTFARKAAFRDSRFAPVARRELPRLAVSVTLLSDFEPAAAWDDWEVGKHGIIVSFSWRGRDLSATYLPHVMTEQGWDKEQAMVSLLHKAGWRGRAAEWRGQLDVDVTRYQGHKAGCLYAQWKAWRQWADGTAE